MNLRIDPEFKDYLGPLGEDARQELEAMLRAEGCRDALVVWPQPEGAPILLDGHNRLEICERLGLVYRMVDCPDTVTDRASAAAWIVQNQRGRRNMTQDQLDYLCGKVFNAEKRAPGGTGANQYMAAEQRAQNGPAAQTGRTADRIAREFGVSKNTVKRHGKFAEQVDAIADEHGHEAKQEILAGRKKVSDYAPQPEPSLEEDAPPEPKTESSALTETSLNPEGDEEAPSASALSESDPLHGWEKMSESEHVQWMTKNLKPNGDSGLRPGPVYFGDTVSENLADPEALRRHEASFMKHLCQIEYHISQLPAAVERDAPDAERGEMLENRLARQVDALQTLIETLKNRRKPC
ncbi:MAG: ParB/Srx family N-terminal domain-containing protein [Planctomycetes bacterium]|nr:ParB/Srx family N-terminal domain-containing protein [Planctomycetota bacterium]